MWTLCIRPTPGSDGYCVLCHLCKPIGCPPECLSCSVIVGRWMYDYGTFFFLNGIWSVLANVWFFLCLCMHRWSWCRWTRGRRLPSVQRTAHCNASRVSAFIYYYISILMLPGVHSDVCHCISRVFPITLIKCWRSCLHDMDWTCNQIMKIHKFISLFIWIKYVHKCLQFEKQIYMFTMVNSLNTSMSRGFATSTLPIKGLYKCCCDVIT